MTRMGRWAIATFAVVLAAAWAGAAEPVAPAKFGGEGLDVSFGGDIRIREVYFDNIPLNADPPGVTRGGQNSFFRFRTRLWGQVDAFDTLSLKARIANECRYYDRPDDNTWNGLDEVIVDNLYLSAKDLFNETLDLCVGRQDLIYGTGKVILEGTPKDGSRTIYVDAAKLSFKGIDKTTVDVFGIYDQPENELVLHTEDRDLTGLAKGYNDMTESGGGVYVKNKSMEALPFEAYYIYKEESDWDQPATRDTEGNPLPPKFGWQTLDAAAGIVENPKLKLHTVGARLMPKLGDALGGNLEAAYQFGDRGDADAEGIMVDAVLNYHLPFLEDMKPCLGAGVYYLSGDDPATTDEDEGWNPLWARWPQYSELYIYAFDADGAGRWSNVNMPHADFSIAPAKWLKVAALVGWLMAPEDDGPGDGKERGLLVTTRVDFTIKEKLLGAKDKLYGHLLLEVLEPGDYYKVGDTAAFARWELSYAF